jgi:uncharacterized damage-inducible protein DinB
MDHKTFFLQRWEKEAPATRKVMGRIPQERCDYRVDPQARTAFEIAWFLVQEELVLAAGLARGKIEWADVPTPARMQQVLDTYDRLHDALTRKLHAIDARRWEARVPCLFGGREVMNGPAYEIAWGFLLDTIHHRGQLSTYLRPMGAKVPSIYGPSADESV